MIFYFVFIPCYLLIVAAMMYNDHTATVPNGNILLGATIPVCYQQDEHILALIKKYKKTYRITSLIFVLLIVPVFFLQHYTMTMITYLFIWIGLLIWINQVQLNQIFDQVMELKKKNGWFLNQLYTVSIDTEVSRLKDKMPVSLWWMALSFVTSILSCILWYQKRTEELPLFIGALTGLFTFLLCLILTLVLRRQSITTISEDTEINLAVNHVFRHEWTKCFAVISNLTSILWLIAYWILPMCDSLVLLIIALCSTGLCGVFFLVSAFLKVRKERNHLLTMDTAPILVDDDIFWRGGTYRNPNDSRFMVEKRIGIGTTINMASKGAKVFYFVIIAVVILCMLPIILFTRYDYSSYTFKITEQTVTIDVASYGYDFTKDQIVSITTIDQLPTYYKNNGYDSSTRCFGKFRVKGYGQCHMYITCDSSPYIVVTLTDTTVILNGDTPEITLEYLAELKQLIRSKE